MSLTKAQIGEFRKTGFLNVGREYEGEERNRLQEHLMQVLMRP